MYNANNYGYNPYGTYIPQRQVPQTIEQIRPSLNGKQVESVEVVKAMDIPLDGSVSYFPIADGSAIVTKRLQLDGTSKTTVYRPVIEENNIVKYATTEDLDKAIEKLDLSDIKDEIENIKSEIKDLKKEK